MCEQFVARSLQPFRLGELWPLVASMERYGLAAFGWGAVWLGEDGELHEHRDVRAFRDDDGTAALADICTTSLLVHLRRPSRLSTLQLADTQPFLDPAGRFAFSHNGEFDRWDAPRQRYKAQGRIAGRADSEVGQRWLEDEWDGDEPVADVLNRLHDAFGGEANLAILGRDGSAAHYAGNPENPLFTYRLGHIGICSTAIYSIDRSLFTFAAPEATDRRIARPGTTVTLQPDGSPVLDGVPRRSRSLARQGA